ncbi:TonB-dependent siderophore receptor [Phreatobacter stygius]|uniref:TonB-dependent siderophore receptor n=1 Tax=Phreatobacter stygius TaxID=1940610 RepID=UPI001FEA4F47|nr:TonB-dependent siderophore receptor [Phreatobacter stygius]
MLCSTAWLAIHLADPAQAQQRPPAAGAPATASRGTATFNVPAGPVGIALTQWAETARLRLLASTDALRGLRTSGVSGVHTPEQALRQLLAGTGLSYRFTNASTVAISRPGAAAAGGTAEGAIALDTIDVQGAGTGDGTIGYVATRSNAATKTNTPLIETPQSISVVSRQQLEDRNVQTLSEAISYTPGVTTGISGFDSRFDAFTIRGFDVTYNGIYRDGLRQPAGNMAIYKEEPYGIQDIFVVRGPSSSLFGSGSPGGLVNLISKRPTSQPLREVELQIGNWDRYQGSFDIGGPADPQGQFLYRLTGVVRESKNWTLGGRDDRVNLAPSFTWRPNDQTSLTVLGEYQSSTTPAAFPYYATTNGARSPAYSSDPAFNAMDQTQFRIGYLLEHRFDEVFTFRQNFRYARVDADVKYVGISAIDPVAMTASRYTGRVRDVMDAISADNQLQANFSTGAIQHTMLFGVDYIQSHLNSRMGFGSAPDLNLVTLNYGAQPIATPALTSSTMQSQRQLGIYAQDQLKWGRWILTLGGRQDWVDTSTRDVIAAASDGNSNHAFTGRAGLTYVFDSGIAPYVSYSTSFVPNLGRGLSGTAFNPTTGSQAEIGIKYQPAGFNGFLTAALFELTQNGGLVTDPTNPSFQIQRGSIRARGLELQAVASLGNGVSLTASYTHLSLVTMKGTPDTVGRTPSGIPGDTVSLWANYAVPPGDAWSGFSVGAGVRYTGFSYGNDQNTFQSDAVALVDAAVRYNFGALDKRLSGLTLKINAQNLFDRNFTTCQAGYCYMGARRTVIASLNYRW